MLIAPKAVKKSFAIDKTLLVILLSLFAFNLIAVYASIPLTVSGSMTLLYKQAFWILLSFGFLIFLLIFGIDRLFTSAHVFYWILMFLLVLLILDKYIDLPFIRPVSGTRAWFQLGSIASFQPSEFMKVILIIQVANIIDNHNNMKNDDSAWIDIKLFAKVLAYAVPPLILILLQPDTGLPLIIVISLSAMVMVSGIRSFWIYLYFFLLISIIGFVLLLFELNPSLLARILGDAYKLNRFYGWLETENYISSYGNQLYQALLAIGSAGWTGHGIQSTLVYFAEPQNDFIFAVIGQNFGFIGASIVVIVNTIFDLKLLSIAFKFEKPREKIMVAGLLGMLLFQQIENMGMITGLLPITGITLPFISSGGSSLLSYMIPLAIIFQMSSENILRNAK
ncbi:MAG: FtsW/RodA/SpoVE family cell cycle protein [Erysipelotrichaceae bacterium]|nr:FtsW/RodA/SpoVE family cell cycle protein [Erysipelotrichaceae bacterium]